MGELDSGRDDFSASSMSVRTTAPKRASAFYTRQEMESIKKRTSCGPSLEKCAVEQSILGWRFTR